MKMIITIKFIFVISNCGRVFFCANAPTLKHSYALDRAQGGHWNAELDLVKNGQVYARKTDTFCSVDVDLEGKQVIYIPYGPCDCEVIHVL